MNAKNILIKALKRTKKERGLRIVDPNNYLSKGHIEKADHNLIVMTDLNKLGHEDWIIISAYYAMYQAAMALLAKIGLESKDHVITVAVLEYFFGEEIGKELIDEFNKLKEEKDDISGIIIEDKYIDYLWKIKTMRETVQYGTSITYKEKDVVMRNAREFVSKIKLVINELNEKLIEIIVEKIKELV